MKKPGTLRLGSNVVELLLPHRRPFLLVDAIYAYEREPMPRLLAGRLISANEDIFRGHFPSLHLWPGTYTQEGLGQSCYLLGVLVGLQKGWTALGEDPEDVLKELRNLELGFRLQAGYRPEASTLLLERLRSLPGHMGMAGSVELKYLAPVFPGDRLDYDVRLVLEVEDLLRFEVEASVDGRAVARGAMTAIDRIIPAVRVKT